MNRPTVFASAVSRIRRLPSTEGNDVVAVHERKGTLCLDGFDCDVPSLCVGFELVVPDVAGVLVIDHFKRSCRIGFQPEDVDREGIAFISCTQTAARRIHQAAQEGLGFGP